MSDQGKIFRVRFESFDDFLVEYGDRLRERKLALPAESELRVDDPVRIKMMLPDQSVVFLKGVVAPHNEQPVTGGELIITLDAFSDTTREKLDACLQAALNQSQDGLPALDDKPLNVLLVDDSVTVRIELGDALRDRGVRVRVAENGLVAVSAALKRVPDVILSDVEMPVMDGWTFLRMVRSRERLRHTPFVFFTRLSDDLSRLQGYKMGVDDYLAKETSPDEVLARISAIVGRQARGPGRQGEAADGLRGDLRHVRLGSLLSFLEGEKRTGSLIIDDGKDRVSIQLVRGAIFGVDDLGPYKHLHDRIFDLLDLHHGEFEFLASDEVFSTDTELTPVTYLLLEHARRSDESAAPEADGG